MRGSEARQAQRKQQRKKRRSWNSGQQANKMTGIFLVHAAQLAKKLAGNLKRPIPLVERIEREREGGGGEMAIALLPRDTHLVREIDLICVRTI